MRYGLIADIHANLPALEAVVVALRLHDVDEVLVAGDLVGYGPHPNECVGRVAEIAVACVAGNHDLALLDPQAAASMPEDARRSLAWTREVLGSAERTYLEGLSPVEVVADIAVAHGSLDDPSRYVATDRDSRAELSRLAALNPGCRYLVLGHTHWQQVVRGPAGGGSDGTSSDARLLVNPGSVGQSRQLELRPRARAAVLDTRAGDVDLLAVSYPHGVAEQDARARGLPERVTHRPFTRLGWRLRRLRP